MVYLIGCDHVKEQVYLLGKKPDVTHLALKKLLIDSIEKVCSTLIAEEQHPDFLWRRRTIGQDVGCEMNILHHFCDMPQNERDKRGIGLIIPPSSSHPGEVVFTPPASIGHLSTYEWHKHNIAHRFPIREEFWISQLGSEIHKSVIFICGAMHVPTFIKRLEGRNIKVEVIVDFVGSDPKLTYTEEFNAREDVRNNGFPPVLIGGNSQCFCTMQQDIPSSMSSDLE